MGEVKDEVKGGEVETTPFLSESDLAGLAAFS
jgi:hypothetical protein